MVDARFRGHLPSAIVGARCETQDSMIETISRDGDLYPWQQEALAAWRANGRLGVVQAVTGAGKTRVGLAAVMEAWRQRRRVVIVVPTLELVEQWAIAVRGVVDGFFVATTTATRRDDWRVLIGTVQTLAKAYPCRDDESTLLIADECHRYGASEFSRALDDRYDWRLGLTATYARDDDGDVLLRSFFKDVVFELWYDRALAEDVIAPFRIALVSVPLSSAERADYEEYSEALWHARKRLVETFEVPSEPVSAFLQAVASMARTEGHPGASTARQYMSAFSRRRTLLANTRAKYQALAVMSDVVGRSAGTLVFTQTQESAELAAQTIAATGHEATAVFSGLDKDERSLRMAAFRDGHVNMLAAPRILDEGVDVPEADLGVIVAANRSRRQMVQRLGRVLRKKHDGRSARFVVLYASQTVEDPTMFEDPSGFYTDCLPHAEAHRKFDIATDVDSLLRFLWAPRPHPAPQRTAPPTEAPATFIWAQSDDSDGPDRLVFEAGATEGPEKDYLRLIGKTPLLSAEREVELAHRIEAGLLARERLERRPRDPHVRDLELLVSEGVEAKDEFVCANLRLVVSVAKAYRGRGLDFLDLIQEGNLGLIRAVEKFDHEKGNKFSTYATWWIRQAITRALADSSRTIRYPVHIVEKLHPIRRLDTEALSRGLPLPSINELAKELDLPPDQVAAHLRLPRSLNALNELVELEAEGWSHPRLRYAFEESVLDVLVGREQLVNLTSRLDDREWYVIACRVGYPNQEPMTLDEIGVTLGVTRERIRQIETKAKQRLVGELAPNTNRQVPPRAPNARAERRVAAIYATRSRPGSEPPPPPVEQEVIPSPPDVERVRREAARLLASWDAPGQH